MDRDDALAHAISNAEAADRLLAADEALAGAMPGGRARDADMGPYGVFEQQRLARFAGATAHAETAQGGDRAAAPHAWRDARPGGAGASAGRRRAAGTVVSADG